MNCTAEMLRLYAVTDRAWVGRQTLPQQVEAALKGGATCVQLREKELDEEAFLKEAFGRGKNNFRPLQSVPCPVHPQ